MGVLRDLKGEMRVNVSYFIVYMFEILKENISKYIQKEPQCRLDNYRNSVV